MRKLFFAGIFLLAYTSIIAQDCAFYYPQKQGAKLEFKSFDAKDKLTGSYTQTIKEYNQEGNSSTAVIETQSFDKKGKDLGTKEFTAKCENGVYSIDMKNYLDQQTLSAYEEMDIEMKSDNLDIPANLKIGDELPNGSLVVSVYSEGMRVMGMTTSITNRKVETKEQITTEAGSFDCYKITYTITVSTMFSVRMEVAEWIAEGVGMVKSETYSRGKTMGYTLLTGIN